MEPDRREVAVLSSIRTVAETGSTNADLLAELPAGIAEATWLRAQRQTAGRGRQGRDWVSPPGNLYASTVIQRRVGDPPAAGLSLVAGVALAESVIDVAGGRVLPMLKWPNDLLVGGAKLSGILLSGTGDGVVAGFGVNLAHAPEVPGRATASLAALGERVAPEALLATLAAVFAAWLARWRGEGLAPVRSRWLALAHPIGTPLAVSLPDGARLTGSFAGLESDGALRLALPGDGERVIHAADVFATEAA